MHVKKPFISWQIPTLPKNVGTEVTFARTGHLADISWQLAAIGYQSSVAKGRGRGIRRPTGAA